MDQRHAAGRLRRALLRPDLSDQAQEGDGRLMTPQPAQALLDGDTWTARLFAVYVAGECTYFRMTGARHSLVLATLSSQCPANVRVLTLR
jgi:hypothetical protein